MEMLQLEADGDFKGHGMVRRRKITRAAGKENPQNWGTQSAIMGQTLRGWFSRFESIDPVSLLLRHLATPWAGAKGIFF